jgi:hypothetical protein
MPQNQILLSYRNYRIEIAITLILLTLAVSLRFIEFTFNLK